MSTLGHIFTPDNDSFKARIEALKGVLQALHNIKLSVGISANEEWSNRLGTPEELQQAQKITKNSLDIAVQALSFSDLNKAKNQGLISDADYKECKVLKAKADLTRQRKSENNISKEKKK